MPFITLAWIHFICLTNRAFFHYLKESFYKIKNENIEEESFFKNKTMINNIKQKKSHQ